MSALPTVDPLPERLLQRGGSADLVRDELLGVIGHAIATHPRSLQTAIGPSELDHPCARRIGYKLMGAPDLNPFPGVPWLPTVGTATHAWLEDAFTMANAGLDHARWVTELTVSVGEVGGREVTGHVDLYDRVTSTALDWKVVGPTPLARYRREGPGRQYRGQAHLYGRGLTRRGLPVDRVMIAFLPRNGELSQAHWWHEPYDERVALVALARGDGIHAVVTRAGLAGLASLPTADAYCSRCPYHRAGSADLREGCPGDPAGQAPAQPALTLTGGGPA